MELLIALITITLFIIFFVQLFWIQGNTKIINRTYHNHIIYYILCPVILDTRQHKKN